MLRKKKERKGPEDCSGCGVCLLSCPVWHGTRTMSLTRKARAKAVQGGASYEEIRHAIDSCLLCGACEKACPEGIGLFDLNMHQRQELNKQRSEYPRWYPGGKMENRGNGGTAKFDGSVIKRHSREGGNPGVRYLKRMDSLLGQSSGMTALKRTVNDVVKAGTLLLAGELLGKDKDLCEALIGLLGGPDRAAPALNDGQEVARFMEAGLALDPARVDSFIMSLRQAGSLIVAEGLLHRPLRKWLPNKKIMGLGEALLSAGPLRGYIGPEDLYMIESRGYHSDHERLVFFYDRLRRETGCQTNLDLQRTAVSTGASSLQGRMDLKASGCIEAAKRILKGRRIRRIVVEDLADAGAFRLATDTPVLHVVQLTNF